MRRYAPVLAVLASWVFWYRHPHGVSDMEQVLRAAQYLWQGLDPYAYTRYGAHGLLYPLTAVLIALPVTFLPLASTIVMGMGWTVYLRAVPKLAWFGLASACGWMVVQYGQWSPLLTGAALVPPMGFLLALKPTIGGALFLAYPSWRALAGIAILGATSLAIDPFWPSKWWHAVSAAPHLQAPVQFWGGPLLLLSLVAWRTPEGRLLAALSCVPQTMLLYDALPLFLIPKTRHEAVYLVCASWAVFVFTGPLSLWLYPDLFQWYKFHQFTAQTYVSGTLTVGLLYLPCLGMVLGRVDTVALTVLKISPRRHHAKTIDQPADATVCASGDTGRDRPVAGARA